MSKEDEKMKERKNNKFITHNECYDEKKCQNTGRSNQDPFPFVVITYSFG